jgi:hypothetical protein
VVNMMPEQHDSARPHEAGFVRPIDGVVHVVKRRVGGNIALCGAGPIETQLVGRFDPQSPDACPACIGLTAGVAAG